MDELRDLVKQVNEKSMELTAPIQLNYQIPEGVLLLFALLTGIVFGILIAAS